ncbi:MAG: DUF2218 domain-containing protein [Thalassobaculaceae bacterium]|nr:DUF2218 domain-containing protein [Thalassobaculaceae bacterium]
MVTAAASVQSELASRYLVQLCKHFAHKIPVNWDDATGFAEFPYGECRMSVEGKTLTMICKATEPEALGTLKHVVDDHLTRFAWKENLIVVWRDTGAVAQPGAGSAF